MTLVTTLWDATRPTRSPSWRDRGRVEVNLWYLKQTLHLEVLHSKMVAGVHKEIRMLAPVYNQVRLVMLRSARLQRVPVERISFVDALRWLMHGSDLARLDALTTHPHCVGRYEPRVRKCRPKEYGLMNRAR